MKEIIRKNFNNLKNKVLENMATIISGNGIISDNDLCGMTSGYFGRVEYSDILTKGLLNILLEISEFKGFKMPEVFRPLSFNRIISINDYCYDSPLGRFSDKYCDVDFFNYKNSFIANLYLFNEEVVFVKVPFTDEKSFLIDFSDSNRNIEKEALNMATLLENEIRRKNITYIYLCKRVNDGYSIPTDVLNKYLKRSGSRVVYLFEYLEEKLPKTIFNFFVNKIDEYNKWISSLTTREGYRYFVTSQWKKIKEQFQIIDYCDLSEYHLTGTGIATYLDYVDLNVDRNLDWIASFTTSEIMYNHVNTLPGIDNTIIVFGYLKSIEQLLTNLILDDAQKNNYVPIAEYVTEDGKHHKITVKEEATHKLVLGKTLNYIRYSKQFIKNTIRRQRLCDILEPWISDIRNGYLHKHVIFEPNKIEEIREKTYKVMYAVLDSLQKKKGL